MIQEDAEEEAIIFIFKKRRHLQRVPKSAQAYQNDHQKKLAHACRDSWINDQNHNINLTKEVKQQKVVSSLEPFLSIVRAITLNWYTSKHMNEQTRQCWRLGSPIPFLMHWIGIWHVLLFPLIEVFERVQLIVDEHWPKEGHEWKHQYTNAL